MPLTISLSTPSAIPLEVDSIQMDVVRTQSPDQIKTTLIQRGNKQVPLGEFFDVSGSCAADETIVWSGDCAKVKLIGSQLTSGIVRVEGNAGMHLGAGMSGGEIICSGDTGDWVGAEMRGGRITIHGNVGHLVGSAYRGGRRGMTGGEILIFGDAGNEVGHTMRRGMIAIAGKTGDAAGVGMIAGSILIFGETGIRYGAGMKRGTIGLFSTDHPIDVLPSFQYACTYQPSFLTIYLKHLQKLHFPVGESLLTAHYRRYCGDFVELGKGELLVRESA